MSVRLMVEVIDHAPRELPDVQHRALIAVAERMNDRTRTGFHPLDELAHRISRSRPTATRTLRALTERGLLAVVSKAGRGKATVYFMPPLLSAEKADAGDDLSDEGPGEGADEPEKVITQDDDLSGEGGTEKVITNDDHLSPAGAPKRSSSEPERSSPNAERSSSDPQKVITQDDDPSLHPSYIPHHPHVRAERPAPPVANAATDDDEELRELDDDPAAFAAMVALRQHTHRTITADHARAVARSVLSGRTAKDPAAYVRSAVDRDPDRHIPAAPARTVAEALARPDGTDVAPSSTEERPAEVVDQLAALRAQWQQETQDRQTEDRRQPTAFARLINPKE
ncbi:hypothetical protein GCM10028793_13590 [Nocardiopsis oceani]